MKRPKKTTPLGPQSGIFRDGSIIDCVDLRTHVGRLVRRLEAELAAHVGGNPSVVQRLLIQHIVKGKLQLDLLEKKMHTPAWTAYDGRVYAALSNSHRLCLRELGAMAAAAAEPTHAEVLARLSRVARRKSRGTTSAAEPHP